MGKKGYNWRSRQVVETQIDNSATKKIKVDFDKEEYGGNDQCNALFLPSEKRKTKVIGETIVNKRKLTRAQRKKYEKVLDRQKKKKNRAALLESLASVQVSEAELKQLTSITTVQTKGTKRFKEDAEQRLQRNEVKTEPEDQENRKLSSVAGSRKRRILALQDSVERAPKDVKLDPNVVGFEESSSSDSDSGSESELSSGEPEINETKEEIPVAKTITPEVKKEVPNEKEIVKPTVDKGKCEIPKKPAVFVELNRDPEVQIARLKLPILAEEQVVMECINENQIVILAGETGSGKTTQVPQFLYEAGYAKDKMIAVTEPRRVAAISMSQRVGKEMNLTSREISYLIRFEGNTTNDTKIKFMTDGVLLKEIQTDFTLSKYSVIILDEAHERSVNTDILIGLLSRIVPLRNKKNNPLKLIIMSATLRIEDFTENARLFKKTPPIIKVESRQYPVTIHFNKRTSDNYLGEAFKKTVKIHASLPQGGILIFVTGQQEVNTLVKKLRKAFPYKNIHNVTKKVNINQEVNNADSDDDLDLEMNMKRAIKNAKKADQKKLKSVVLPKIDLDNYELPGDDADADLHENSDILDSDLEEDELNLKGLTNTQPLWVMPLYALLPSHKQAKIFQDPPEGTRLCIVATNLAETSITIPNVKYVVDTGRQKTKLYDKVTGVTAYVVTYCSKAGANQRAGRAGRTGPGHCYRLYSSAVFKDQFDEFSVPEIQKKPVDHLMLQMKCMGIDKVVNFPFPSSPDLLQLRHAERRLMLLGALEIPSKLNFNSNAIDFTSKVTPLGQAIFVFPVAPRFGKMLALSHQQSLLPYTICMVAALSVQEVLLEVSLDNEASKRSKWALKRRSWAGIGNSLFLGDPMVLIRAVGALEYAGTDTRFNLEQFCLQNGLRPKAISEIRKLRVQLTNEINLNMPDVNLCVDPRMTPPTDLQAKLLRQILLSGMGDQVAKKLPESDIKQNEDKKKFRYAYQCSEIEEPVFMHSCSVLRKQQPEWVIYQEVYEIQNGDSTKMFIRGITAIEPDWLPKYVPRLCNLGKPLSDPPPRFCQNNGKVYCHVSGTFGRSAWELPVVEIEYPNDLECYKWFARFLLEGEVCTSLVKFKSSLLSQPSIMIKSWAKLHKRTDLLLKTLASRGVNTRPKLMEVWEQEPEYLLSAYLQWLPESAHNEVALVWPPT